MMTKEPIFNLVIAQYSKIIMAAMVGSMPSRRDYLQCIRNCNPKTSITHSDYFVNAKECLKLILPASSSISDEDLSHTSRLFVNKVREEWKKSKIGKNYKTLIALSWFNEPLEVKSPAPKPLPVPSTTPPEPPKPPTTRKSFDDLSQRQQDRITAKCREQYEPRAIVQAAVQYFRGLGCHDAAYVLKNMNEDPQQIGGDLRKLLANPNEKLPQVSKSKCLAYILDRGMTLVDWNETCNLVNEQGNYRLPCYSRLQVEKQKNRPRGKNFQCFLSLKASFKPLG